ncbi:MAG TPA: glycosyltransferase family 2 protein [Ktedonobacterales bacterium]
MGKPSRFPRVSVIIPTLNEADNLPYVLPAVAEIAAEVILVDGHSVDDTPAVARRLLPDIRIVQQSGKGKGNALRCGFAEATGDIVVMMDADGSTDPIEIPRFVDALLAGADVAKGSRFLGTGGSSDITRLRRLGNRALNGMVNRLFQTPFTDLCYGYIALWRVCLDFFDIDCDGFEVETQINLRARKANLKIVEVPSFEHERRHGASHLNTFRDGWRVLRMIAHEWRRGYATIKTPGVHRAYHMATVRELATFRELASIRDLATMRAAPERGLPDGLEHLGAV